MARRTKLFEAQKELGERLLRIRASVADKKIRSVNLPNQRLQMLQMTEQFEENHEELVSLGVTSEDYFTKQYYEGIQKLIVEIESHFDKYMEEQGEGVQAAGFQGGLSVTQEEACTSAKGMPQAYELMVNPAKESLQERMPQTKELLVNPGSMEHRQAIKSIEERMQKSNGLPANPEKQYLRKMFFRKAERILEVLGNWVSDETSLIDQSLQQILAAYRTLREENLADEEVECTLEEVQYTAQQTQRMMMKRVINHDREIKRNVKLEDIKIPEFSGDINEWESFHDLFKKLIHEATALSDVEKMLRLKSAVKGEAKQLLQHLRVTEANYTAAFDILKHRYENKRLLFTTQVDTILDQPTINSNSAKSIRQLLDTTRNCLQALKSMNIDLTNADQFIARIIVRKLDAMGRRMYEQSVKRPREIQTMEAVLEFLEQQYQSLEAVSKQQPCNERREYKKQMESFAPQRCLFCYKNGHLVMECRRLAEIPTGSRSAQISSKMICKVCLKHRTDKPCYSSARCKQCGGRHHELLHINQEVVTNKANNNTRSAMITNNALKTGSGESKQVILATAQVKVRAASGEDMLLRAIIDPGSQVTSISEEAAQLLALPRVRNKTEIHGLSSAVVGVARHQVNLEVRPRFLSNNVFKAKALVLPTITTAQPCESFHVDEDEWKSYVLADPMFNKSDRVDMVIGGDIYADIMEEGMRNDVSFAQKTKLGWIISGKLNIKRKSTKVVSAVTNLERFWELEEISSPNEESSDDNRCLDLYKKTTQVDSDGRLVVRLPWKDDTVLGDSRKQAVARLLAIERKLQHDSCLKDQYVNFMREYQELGHMKALSKENSGKYYLPHHPVIREDSLTTKLRVVFDASAKTTNGKCLNDIMFTGPRLQKDIFDIILKWRLWKYVLMADVEKMYRQVRVAEADQKYQLILWREDKKDPIKEFQLKTVTYGTASAPFLAVRSLFEIADHCEKKDELIKKIIRQDFYMDDLMTGADTIDDCKEIQQGVCSQLKRFGFHLRKWCSNCKQTIEGAAAEHQNDVINIEEECVKTLGLQWDPKNDTFGFHSIEASWLHVTKREALSYLAKIFDPLGWCTPVTILAKLFIQQLWIMKIDWDAKLPENLLKEWCKIVMTLFDIKTIKISRWLHTTRGSSLQLLGFADASEKAYAAVVYVKAEEKISMVAAKSKVNPIKNRKTLPKLELCAAHLLAQLMHKIVSVIEREVELFTWSDSTITLAWINNNNSKDKFIKRRVTEIKTLLPKTVWGHVSTKENPADVASRGIHRQKLEEHLLWWNGPTWMIKSPDQWPKLSQPEEITERSITATTFKEESNFLDSIVEKYSKLTTLYRVLAYVLRFKKKVQDKVQVPNYLTVEEIEAAEYLVILHHQRMEFHTEITRLKTSRAVDNSSKIVGLNPFLDEKGILRVGGRLGNADMEYSHKHPIIMRRCHLAVLVVREAHLNTLHGGNNLVESMVRRRYWIIGAKKLVKKIVRSCARCTRFRKENAVQIMGNLPEVRVTSSHPFTHTGVDFAGPIYMKCSRGRGRKTFKGYIAVFVCMVTRAIHLEAVSDLTADAFLAALKRFFGRRGKAKCMYSDNGTNFVGAAKKLDAEFKAAIRSNSALVEMLEADRIEWKFIPPASPHFGGIWEAGVKAVKKHLLRVIGETVLTYEEISTLLTQIEAVLNSRPIGAITTNPEEVDILTPGHWLIGQPLIGAPEHVNEEKISCLDRWKLVQKIKRDFWKRWKDEYLSTLQTRYKWRHQKENLKENQVVIIKDESVPAARWPLGRIIQTHKGKDGKVRVATLRLANGVVKRPIHKLCPLEDAEEETSMDNCKLAATNSLLTKTSRKTIRMPNLTEWVLFFLMLTNIVLGTMTSATKIAVHELSNNTVLYMDKIGTVCKVASNWNLVLYYDMEAYFTAVEHIGIAVDKGHRLCKKLQTFEAQCDSIIRGMKNRLEDMEQNDLLYVQSRSVRSKRAPLEFIGSLYHILFGIMDADDRKVIEDNMRTLLENQNNVEELMQRQASVIEATANILKKTTQEVNAHFSEVYEKINNMSKVLNENFYLYRESVNFFMMTKNLEALLYETEKTQGQIINLLIDVNHGKINTNLVRPKALQLEMFKIKENLDRSLRLPGKSTETTLQSVYRLMTSRGMFLDGKLIIDIKIPLLEARSSDLMRMVSLPVEKDGVRVIVKLRKEYMAYNYELDAYHLMSKSQLNECQLENEGGYMCQERWPWMDANDRSCELSSIKPANRHNCQFEEATTGPILVELQSRRGWLYKLEKETPAHIVCAKSTQTLVKLGIQGILPLSPGCTARIGSAMISSPRERSTKTEAKFNNMGTFLFKTIEPVEISQPVKYVSINNTKLIDELMQEMKLVKTENKELKQLKWHHVSGHTGLVISCIIAIVLFIVWIHKYCKSSRSIVKIDFSPPNPMNV